MHASGRLSFGHWTGSADDTILSFLGVPERLSATTSAVSGSGNGKHLPKAVTCKKFDSTLPAAYARKLYGNLPRGRAYLLYIAAPKILVT